MARMWGFAVAAKGTWKCSPRPASCTMYTRITKHNSRSTSTYSPSNHHYTDTHTQTQPINTYIHTYIHISYHSFTPSPTYLSIHLSHLPFPSHPIPQKPQNSAQKPDGEGTARSISAETIVGTQRSIYGRGNEQSRTERNRTDRRDRNKQTQA